MELLSSGVNVLPAPYIPPAMPPFLPRDPAGPAIPAIPEPGYNAGDGLAIMRVINFSYGTREEPSTIGGGDVGTAHAARRHPLLRPRDGGVGPAGEQLLDLRYLR